METLRINLLVSPEQHPELYARLSALPIKVRAEQVRHLCSLGAMNTGMPQQAVKFSLPSPSFKQQSTAQKPKRKAEKVTEPASEIITPKEKFNEGKPENALIKEEVYPLNRPNFDIEKLPVENTPSMQKNIGESASTGDVFAGFDFSSMD